jgi:hypothetical protein
MVISASRRTDIPAFYTDWFIKRLEQGHVMFRNPFQYHTIYKYTLTKETVEFIVFWTKNPLPMIPHLHYLHDCGYPYYVLFTLNPYGPAVEPRIPSLHQRIDTFIRLCELTGPMRVIWRYDPIIINPSMDFHFHTEYFREIASALQGYTKRCITSFFAPYKKVLQNCNHLDIQLPSETEKKTLISRLVSIAEAHRMELRICADPTDYSEQGAFPSRCIDNRYIEAITGRTVHAQKDPHQRSACRCIESVDIGSYDSCLHGCLYCYANSNRTKTMSRSSSHDPNSPLLIGWPGENDSIVEKKKPAIVDGHPNLL